jgi:phage tail sheath protein FI
MDFLCLPPRAGNAAAGPALLLAAMRYCRRRGAMLVIDPPMDCKTPRQLLDYVGSTHLNGPNALITYPGLEKPGKNGMRPNAGAVAGSLARHDHRHGIWVSDTDRPAVLATGFRPFVYLDPECSRRLTAQGINVLTRTAGGRLGIFGDTTLAGRDAPVAGGHSLAERRLYLNLHDTLARGSRWVVFAKPGAASWRRLTHQLTDLLGRLHGLGAFGDQAFEEACFVRCDARTQRGADDSAVVFVVGYRVRAGRPAIVLRVVQSVAGATVTPMSMDRYRIFSGDWMAGRPLRAEGV